MIRNRALERVVQELQRQRCDSAYIKYYLMEEYHVDDETAQTVMEFCGVQPENAGPKKRGLYNRNANGKPGDPDNKKNKDRFGSYFG